MPDLFMLAFLFESPLWSVAAAGANAPEPGPLLVEMAKIDWGKWALATVIFSFTSLIGVSLIFRLRMSGLNVEKGWPYALHCGLFLILLAVMVWSIKTHDEAAGSSTSDASFVSFVMFFSPTVAVCVYWGVKHHKWQKSRLN